MERYQERFLDVLKAASLKCTSQNIALSGGLDSSAIAYCIRHDKPNCYALISRDFVATDLPYCQMISSNLGLELDIIKPDMNEIISGIEETIQILGNFNDIEVRNSLVMYLIIKRVKERGKRSIITGDGADELFAGYSFLLKKSDMELEEDLQRIAGIMHFPSKKIGKSLGISVETPFLDETMIEFAKDLPLRYKTGMHDAKKFGKMIVRNSLDGRIPSKITWREKTPMQDGSGTAGLTGLFERLISDKVFEWEKKEIRDKDGVNIRTKESLYYYQIFRRSFASPRSNDPDDSCPDCGHEIRINSKFCNMCGRFPI